MPCENRILTVTNSRDQYPYCVWFNDSALGKIYYWPEIIPVPNGYLKRSDLPILGVGYTYTFMPAENHAADSLSCDNKVITASNTGKQYVICIPASNKALGRILAWPESINVSGGYLKRSALPSLSGGYSYQFLESGGGGTNGGTNGALCENKVIRAANTDKGYLVCIPFSVTALGKIYSWPEKIKVTNGYLLRDKTQIAIVYNFSESKVKKTNGNGGTNGGANGGTNGGTNGELIPGVPNMYLIIGAAAALLLLRS
jgi:hypothetical protein